MYDNQVGIPRTRRLFLEDLLTMKNPDGSFPEAGPPLLQQGSDTYHMWTMIGTYNYVLYTNDTAFLARNWAGYQQAMAFITSKQGESELLDVTGVRDWARLNVGGNMTEAQVILYRTLTTGAELAIWMGASNTTITAWTTSAENLRLAIMASCYDPQVGLFRDNALPSTAIYPQDANSLALAFGMVGGRGINSSLETDPLLANISDHLVSNWLSPTNAYPVTHELPGHISPFISSWEVRGHFVAGETDRALALMRAVWGQYLDRPDGSQSSLVEGLLVRPDGQTPSFGYRWNRGYGGAHNDTAVAASYTSHSHGWSAGPTSALTEFVLGLSVTGVAGSTWRFAPQVVANGSNSTKRVTRAEGGFVTSLGKYQASWNCSCCSRGTCGKRGVNNSFNAVVNSPPNTSGTILVPSLGHTTGVEKREVGVSKMRVVLDGVPVQGHQIIHYSVSSKRKASIVKLQVQGGQHTVEVSWVSD